MLVSLWIAVTHWDAIFVNLELRTQFELGRYFQLEGNLQIILRTSNFSLIFFPSDSMCNFCLMRIEEVMTGLIMDTTHLSVEKEQQN